MRINIIHHDEGVEKYAQLAFDKNLVPIIGSGFSKGSKAHGGSVPDTAKAIQILTRILTKNVSGVTSEMLSSFDFDQITTLFFSALKRTEISADIKDVFFRDYFTEVTLGEVQHKWIDLIDWEYLYTLNVDDAIERTGIYSKILPYKKFKRGNKTSKLLYKLHGDANYEILYADTSDNNLVFSNAQYLNAITSEDNSEIYNNLTADYLEKHLLFLGCSLAKESDIEFIYNKCEKSDNTYRCVVRTTPPSLEEELNLERYGVNEVLLVNSFDLFYLDFIAKYEEIQSTHVKEKYKFLNPKISVCSTKEEALKSISGVRAFNETSNTFIKSKLHIMRNCIKDVEKGFKSHDCVLLKGRRFSGKTFILCNICERFQRYKIYFFPSTIMVDASFVETILTRVENSLLIFDSNSISSGVYSLLSNATEIIASRKNKILLAFNSNDNNIINALDAEIVNVPNSFYGTELELNKRAADFYGLIKRNAKNTNLDYLYRIQSEQKIAFQILDTVQEPLRYNENILTLLLAIFDKVYISDALTLGVSSREINEFAFRFHLLTELLPTDKTESSHHSAHKLVHNSKFVLLDIISKMEKETVIKCILSIVSKYSKDKSRRRLYVEVILFDTLNQLFRKSNQETELIFDLYARMQPLLDWSLDYWLQRSKSIYRMFPDNKHLLLEAYGYAQKAYSDGWETMKNKAALTGALIDLLLIRHSTTEDERCRYTKEAIEKAHESILSEYYTFNKSYLNSELRSGQQNSHQLIFTLCRDVISRNEDRALVEKARQILMIMDDLMPVT